jgi:hypothetical protein
MQRIAPPLGPQNPQGYTEDEILHVLRGHRGSRKFDFRYSLLNSNNEFKDDISDVVTDGVIDQNWLAPIKRTGQFEILGSADSRIDYLVDRIQPWIRLQMPTKMIPNGAEISTLWDNDFDAAAGVVTPENSLLTGDPLSTVANHVTYDGNGYMNLGSANGTGTEFGTGQVSLGFKTRSSVKYTIWCIIPVNGNLNIGLDGDTVNSDRWVQLDDTFDGAFRLGTSDVTVHKANFVGGDIRIELVYDGRLARWSVFWSDPYGGTEPDLTVSQDATTWGQLRLIQISGGGFNQLPTKVTQFKVETPLGPEQEPRIRQVWSNSFNGLTGDAVTSSSLGQVGNVPDGLGGDLAYTDDWSIDSVRSLKLGDTDPGWIRARITQRDQWFMRSYCYIPTGGRLVIAPMDDNTFTDFSNSSPLDVSPFPEAWMRFDDAANIWTVAGIDVSSFSSRLVDVPFRIELEIVSGQYFWRIYIVDPQGRAPDISWSGEADETWNSIRWFGFWGGGDATVPVMIDNVLLGEPQPLFAPVPESENYVEWPQGVFVMSSPRREIDRNGVIIRQVQGYDVIQTITHDKLDDRLVIKAGTKYIDVVNQLLGDVPKRVSPSEMRAARDREWAVGYSKRQAINDMLQSINFESISADEMGNFVVQPYVLPDKRTPEFNYLDDEDSVMMPEAATELDLFEVPNKWILSVTNPDKPAMKAVLTNNDPSNPTSTVRRQQTIVDFRELEDTPSYPALMRRAQRYAWAASRKFEAVEFETLMMPFHSGNDCYNVRYTDLGVDEKYLEHYWVLRLRAGEKMQHRARRVRNFNPHDDKFHMNNVEFGVGFSAGNIHAGTVSITPVANVPTTVQIRGYELMGSGPVDVQVTMQSSDPSITRMVGTQDEGPRRFNIWLYRTNTTATIVHYFVMRNA